MKLPDAVKSVRDAFAAVFPVPQGSPSEAQEDLVRQWSITFAQQVRFSTGDPTWGMKRADPGRPISKDTLAKMDGDRLLIWDLFQGTGTGFPKPLLDPDSQDVTGQFFEAVVPVDYLPREQPSVEPRPTPTVPVPPELPMCQATACRATPCTCNLEPLKEELRSLKVELILMRSLVSDLYGRKPPVYKGSYGITLKPEGV